MPKENESISLGKIGIVDGGVYDPKKTYNSGTFVLHNGSTWLAMKDNLTGATPEEGTNWKYLARGFASEMLSLITAIDSQGLLGSKGAEVTGQALIDKLADMAANKLIQKASMSNVQANDQNKVPTSALAYAMNRSITQNEEAITQLNRDIEYKSVSVEKNTECVTDSYSLGFNKSGLNVLTIDVYTNETIKPYTEYTILRTAFRPQNKGMANLIVNTGKMVAVSCELDGSVKLSTNEASGKFNIRGQLVFV